jgi:hypothetical protein
MSDKAISPLRRRTIKDRTIRKFAPKTQASYIRAVRNFTVFLGGKGPADSGGPMKLEESQIYFLFPCKSA